MMIRRMCRFAGLMLLAGALHGCAMLAPHPAPEPETKQRTMETQRPGADNGKPMWIWVAPGYRESLEREDQSYSLRRVPH